MKKKISLLLSELSTILEDSLTLRSYPVPRTKTSFNFLKYTDDSYKHFLITVCKKKMNYYIVYDSTIYCYAFYDGHIPMNVRLMVFGKVYGNRWMVIDKWRYIDMKKMCYNFF